MLLDKQQFDKLPLSLTVVISIGQGESMNTDFLYARPSFLEGIARLVDFGGTLNEYNQFPTPQEADAAAIRSDWAMIGQDMWYAIHEFEAEESDNLTSLEQSE